MKFIKVAICILFTLASFWLGAYGMHVVGKDDWTHFPIYFTAFCGFLGGLFATVYTMVES